MHADDPTTFRACPFLFVFQKELLCTNPLDPNSIFDQTDVISQPVPFIDLLDK